MKTTPRRGLAFRVLLAWTLLPALAWGVFHRLTPTAPVAPPSLRDAPGARLFYQMECGRCHTLSQLPGARGSMGPRLDHVGSRAALRRPGMSARDYLTESLVKPQAYVVEGYLKTMPSFDGLPPSDLEELVTYLEGLR